MKGHRRRLQERFDTEEDMNVFTEPLRELEAYNILRETLEEAGIAGRPAGLLADSCVDPQKANLLYALCREESLAGQARLRLSCYAVRVRFIRRCRTGSPRWNRRSYHSRRR